MWAASVDNSQGLAVSRRATVKTTVQLNLLRFCPQCAGSAAAYGAILLLLSLMLGLVTSIRRCLQVARHQEVVQLSIAGCYPGVWPSQAYRFPITVNFVPLGEMMESQSWVALVAQSSPSSGILRARLCDNRWLYRAGNQSARPDFSATATKQQQQVTRHCQGPS
jgi:hypothetical protein